MAQVEPLAVGARHMERRETKLRITQPGERELNALEPHLDARRREPREVRQPLSGRPRREQPENLDDLAAHFLALHDRVDHSVLEEKF